MTRKARPSPSTSLECPRFLEHLDPPKRGHGNSRSDRLSGGSGCAQVAACGRGRGRCRGNTKAGLAVRTPSPPSKSPEPGLRTCFMLSNEDLGAPWRRRGWSDVAGQPTAGEAPSSAGPPLAHRRPETRKPCASRAFVIPLRGFERWFPPRGGGASPAVSALRTAGRPLMTAWFRVTAGPSLAHRDRPGARVRRLGRASRRTRPA